jgi:DNA-binding response OmpR family regulator
MSDPSTGAAGGRDPRARLRALVVDHERPLVAIVTSYLEREGFEVLAAHDGERAVELARDERPDVIVLDLMLPGIDGLEAYRRIRALSDAYVLMLTAKAEEADKIAGLSTGADDYLGRHGHAVCPARRGVRRPRRRRHRRRARRRRPRADLRALLPRRPLAEP